MAVQSQLGSVLKGKRQGMTAYQFWKETGFGRRTAYQIFNDSSAVPTGRTLNTICEMYDLQPGDFLHYVPDNEMVPA